MRAGGVYPVYLDDVPVTDETHNLNINNWSKIVNKTCCQHVNNSGDSANISRKHISNKTIDKML